MKNRSKMLIAMVSVGTCSAFLPPAHGQLSSPPDGCYSNFTTAEGCKALNSLTTGSANTALGWSALYTDSDGSFNTAVGGGALIFNDGSSNTAVGAATLLLNSTGVENTAVGTDALALNTIGNNNCAFGAFALYSNQIAGGGSNAFGFSALHNNDSDGAGMGLYNNAFGWEALALNVDGAENTAMGDSAGAGTTGSYNTAIGAEALLISNSGDSNVAIGIAAGNGITTASNVIAIGASVSGASSVFGAVDNSCYIGNISGAEVDVTTSALVYVDADGKLGTLNVDRNGNEATLPGIPRANPPQAVPRSDSLTRAKQAMLDRKVDELQATVTRQQKQIDVLSAGLQKVSAQLEMRKDVPQTVAKR